MLFSDLHRFFSDLGRRFRQSTKNTAGVEPSRAFVTKYFLPVDIAFLELRHRRISPIRTSESSTDAETAFGKVHTVANSTPNAIVLRPLNMRLIDAALIDQVLNQAADRIIGKCGNDRRVETETTLQTAGDVILTATLPHFERPRRMYPFIARIEPEHYLAKGNDVPFTFIF